MEGRTAILAAHLISHLIRNPVSHFDAVRMATNESVTAASVSYAQYLAPKPSHGIEFALASIIFVSTRRKVQRASSFDSKATGSFELHSGHAMSTDNSQANCAPREDFESSTHCPGSSGAMSGLIIFI